MNYDEDKIDEYTLALLYLVTHERQEGLGARAWKGFDWDTLNRLNEKGYISNPVGKAKSVGMTGEGFLKAKELFERHFVKETTIPFPKLTPSAKKRWEQIPEQSRKDILENVWCSQCRTMGALQLREGEMSGRSLVLRGTCRKCGSEAARVVEPV
ncbi:MAG: DUF6429 family protein [Desulfobacterales bacterium]